MLHGLGFMCTGLMRQGTIGDGLAHSWYWLLGAGVCAVVCLALLAKETNSLLRNVVIAMFVVAGALALFMGVVFFRIGTACNPADVVQAAGLLTAAVGN